MIDEKPCHPRSEFWVAANGVNNGVTVDRNNPRSDFDFVLQGSCEKNGKRTLSIMTAKNAKGSTVKKAKCIVVHRVGVKK